MEPKRPKPFLQPAMSRAALSLNANLRDEISRALKEAADKVVKEVFVGAPITSGGYDPNPFTGLRTALSGARKHHPYGTIMVGPVGKAMVTTDHGTYADVVFIEGPSGVGSIPLGIEAADRWERVDE